MSVEEYVFDYVMHHSTLSEDQKRSFMLHAKRVQSLVYTYQPHNLRMANIAVAHDFLEDTDFTAERMKEDGLIHDSIVDSIVALTRRNDETYEEYILRVKNYSEEVTKIKIYDILDHLACIETLKPSLKERYLKALVVLFKEETGEETNFSTNETDTQV